MPPGRIIWAINGDDRSNRPICSEVHVPLKREKIDAWGWQFHACADTPPLNQWTQYLHVGWGPRHNQLYKIFWKSIQGFPCRQTPKYGISHWLCWSSLIHSHTTVWGVIVWKDVTSKWPVTCRAGRYSYALLTDSLSDSLNTITSMSRCWNNSAMQANNAECLPSASTTYFSLQMTSTETTHRSEWPFLKMKTMTTIKLENTYGVQTSIKDFCVLHLDTYGNCNSKSTQKFLDPWPHQDCHQNLINCSSGRAPPLKKIFTQINS